MESALIVLIASVVIAADVYLVTNPYVLIQLMHDRTALLSNLQNSQAMYQAPVSMSGVFNALKLMALGSGVLMFGVLGVAQIRKHPILQLLASVSIVVLANSSFSLRTSPPSMHASRSWQTSR